MQTIHQRCPKQGSTRSRRCSPNPATPAPRPTSRRPTRPPTKPPPPKIANVTLSGQFTKADVTYTGLAGKVVLELNGAASGLSATPSTVSVNDIALSKPTTYDILSPDFGQCNEQPEIVLSSGQFTLLLQGVGDPGGPIYDCYVFSANVKASGFKARFADVPLPSGETITELDLDLAAPPK